MDPLTKNAGALIQLILPRWRRARSAYVIAGAIDRAVASFARPLARYLARFFQGAKGRRSSDRDADPFRACHQFQDRQGARPRCAAHAPLARADEVIK